MISLWGLIMFILCYLIIILNLKYCIRSSINFTSLGREGTVIVPKAEQQEQRPLMSFPWVQCRNTKSNGCVSAVVTVWVAPGGCCMAEFSLIPPNHRTTVTQRTQLSVISQLMRSHKKLNVSISYAFSLNDYLFTCGFHVLSQRGHATTSHVDLCK